MIKKFSFLTAFFLLLGSGLFAQPCEVDVDVYSTIFPEDTTLTDNFFLCDGFQASNGEYVGIGVRARNNPDDFDACFFRLDNDGDLIAPPVMLGFTITQFTETAFVLPSDEDYKSLGQITEIFDAAGTSQGYFVSMTTISQSVGLGIVVARLNHSGLLQTSRIIPSEKDDMRSVDCLQRSDNLNMVVLCDKQNIQTPDNVHNIYFAEIDPSTCNLISGHECIAGQVTSQFPYEMEQFKAGNNTNFFVVSRVDSAGLKHVGTSVFDGSYNVQPYGKGRLDMRTNSTTETPFPTGLVMRNNNLVYVSGYFNFDDGSDLSEPFILEATIAPPIPAPLINWVNKVPTSGLFNNGMHFTDLKLSADDNLMVLGNTNAFSGNLSTTTMLKFSTSGSFLWGRQPQNLFAGGNYPAQAPVVVDATADGGFWVGASFFVNPNGRARIFAMKTDVDGWLDNCDCIAPHTPLFQSLVPPVLPHLPFTVSANEPTGDLTVEESETPLGQVFCDQYEAPTCEVNFAWQPTPDCNGVELFANPLVGIGPFTYSWDFDGDNVEDATGENVILPSFPPGVHTFCVTMTDATGCTASFCDVVEILPDVVPPPMDCPDDITLSTNTINCTAMYNPLITATDDCGPVTLTCTLSGATSGTVTNTEYNLGVTIVTCTATDGSGNVSTCSFIVTVVDNTPPDINCPPPPALVDVAACLGGANVDFGTATALDDCSQATITGSHVSGDFFPCGPTMVSYTATDEAGNAATCDFTVNINCLCGEVSGADIECTANPNVFTFEVAVEDLTGSGGNCTLTVSNGGQTGVTIFGSPATWVGNIGTVTGTITLAPGCVPVNLFPVVTLTCQCPNGPVSCSLPFTLDVPCCRQIQVDDAEVCESAAQLLVPLNDCLVLPDVQQVRWYVAYAPCPPIGDPAWGTPYQVTNGCADLVLLPKYLTGDVCVYAEVLQGDCGGPCALLTSNVANINLCAPISSTITSITPWQLCSNAVPPFVTLTAAYDPAGCASAIQWYNHAGILLGQTGNTLTVTGLSFAAAPITGVPDDCWREYLYRAVITGQPCGDQSTEYRIRIYDNDAGVGTLTLLPPDVQPFCPGEDAQIRYEPECAAQPPAPAMWNWLISSDGSTYSPLTTAGAMNPLLSTNKRYYDTWYKVTKKNGVCIADELTLMIDVYDRLVISDFAAYSLDPCKETGVNLQVHIDSSSSCGVTIEWYKDGYVIHTSTSLAGVLNVYDYMDGSLNGDYSGNYYVVVTDLCCADQIVKSNVLTMDPPCRAVVLGPCSRCKDETVQLTGLNIDPPNGSTCNHQWYRYDTGSSTWVSLPGENGSTLTVVWPETKYKWETECGGCVKEVEFEFEQCGPFSGVAEPQAAMLQVAPNPTTGQLTIWLPEPAKENTRVRIADAQGRLVLLLQTQLGANEQQLELGLLPSGIYFIQLWSGEGLLGMAKVVKE
ncbi:MAG: HYR domain-containing protein [Saprospiraceae bacterium]